MKTKRREFLQQAGALGFAAAVAPAAGATLAMEGCSFSSAMANLAKYLPIGLQALAGVAALLSPGVGTAIAALIGVVNVAWGGLQSAVNSYNSAPASAKQNALGEVLTAIDAVQTALGNATKSLGIASDKVVKAATAALALISTTLGAIEAQLAPQAPAPTASVHVAHATANSVTNVAVDTSIPVSGKPQDFKKTYCTIMSQAGRPDLML